MNTLPSFLELISANVPGSKDSLSCAYMHPDNLAQNKNHCLWWPCKAQDKAPSVFVLFIPGNPGLVEFYIPFLEHVRHASPDNVAMLGFSLLGHSPNIAPVPRLFSQLTCQIEAVINIIDTIKSTFTSCSKLVLVGHSVGSWLVMQALRERSSVVTSAFLLCPTLANIKSTPNGTRLSWIACPPIPQIISKISGLIRFLPRTILRTIYPDWPSSQLQVLWSFINCPASITSALTMMRDEMQMIKDLDTKLMEEVQDKLYFYFAIEDDWVGQNREVILREMKSKPHAVRVSHGPRGIPHAFCINHGKELGEQCLQWLEEDVFYS